METKDLLSPKLAARKFELQERLENLAKDCSKYPMAIHLCIPLEEVGDYLMGLSAARKVSNGHPVTMPIKPEHLKVGPFPNFADKPAQAEVKPKPRKRSKKTELATCGDYSSDEI